MPESFLSNIAFVPTVVPCLNSKPSPAPLSNSTPAITARPGSPGVDRTFTTRVSPSTTATQSVKVPPVSIAILNQFVLLRPHQYP